MAYKLPEEGLQFALPLKKDVESEGPAEHESSKYVRLRFTRKQYEAFRNACTILEAVSIDPHFSDFVSKSLNADIRPRVISAQLVKPIVDAPTKISDPALKAARKPSGAPRTTYFTAPIELTKACRELYSEVKSEVEGMLKYEGNVTCVTDIRVMIGKYMTLKNLRNEHGTIVDDFLIKIANETFKENKRDGHIIHINGDYVIPRGNRKFVTQMVSEIASP